MSKIIGSITTTPMAIPDWNQDNPNKADYIKNKPEIISEERVEEYVNEKIKDADNSKQAIKFENGLSIESRENGIYLVDTNSNEETLLWLAGAETYAIYSDYAFYSDNAYYSDEAGFAESARCDGDGNDIAETYATKAEVGAGAQKIIQFENGLNLESRDDGIYLTGEYEDGETYEQLLYSDGYVFASDAVNAEYAGYADYASEATVAYEDDCGRPLKGCLTHDRGDEESVDIDLYDGEIASYGVISTSLNASVYEEDIRVGYMSALYFTTPSEIPDDYSYFPDKIYFKGDDVVDSRFVPEADTRYSIVFFCDGNLLVGCVLGVPAPPVDPEEEVIE